MPDPIKILQISNKIQKCQQTVKKLYGVEYKLAIATYVNIIKGCMAKHKITNVLEAVLQLEKESKHMPGADVFLLKILAGAAEILNPTP